MVCGSRRVWAWLRGAGTVAILAALIAIAGCSKKPSSSSGSSGERTTGPATASGGGGAGDLLPSDQKEIQRLKSFMTGGLPPRQQYPTIKAMAENLKLSSEARDQAKAYLKELEAKLRKDGEDALAPVVKSANEALEEGNLAQAMAAYDQFVSSYPENELPLIKDLIDARRGEVMKKIDEQFASDKLKIEGAVAEGRFDEALAIVREIGSYGDEKKRTWAEEKDAEIEATRKKKSDDMERMIAESKRKAEEEELKKEGERKKAEEEKKKAEEGEASGAEGTGKEEPAPEGKAAPKEPAAGEEGAAAAGEPFAMTVTLASFDKKTGHFEIKPLQTPTGPKRTYKLEIPDGAQCHVDAIVPPNQLKSLQQGCQVWLYCTTVERSRPSPTGNTYDRMIQNPEAVAFGPAINPNQEYKNPRMAEAKWHLGRLAEYDRGPLPIVIEGKTFELRGRPQNECYFQRTQLEMAQFRQSAASYARRIAVVLGEASEEPKDPDAKGATPKTPAFLVKARACLFLEPKLARVPIYRALYENYDPRVVATEKAAEKKDDKADEKKAGRKKR